MRNFQKNKYLRPMTAIDSKKLIKKTIEQLNPDIIFIPKGAEFSIDGNVFIWESNKSGGILLRNLPIIKNIDVTIGFKK